jgi:hypothetical protein
MLFKMSMMSERMRGEALIGLAIILLPTVFSSEPALLKKAKNDKTKQTFSPPPFSISQSTGGCDPLTDTCPYQNDGECDAGSFCNAGKVIYGVMI